MSVSAEENTRYDRQVRLWGEEGQESIGATSVCIFGSDSLGAEILKSLVLAGIQSFFIVDDTRVDISDIGQNFFLEIDDIGNFRASATLQKILELNSSVTGGFSIQSPISLSDEDLEKVSRCSVVITANQTEDVEEKYSEVLYNLGIPLVCARTFGLLGTIKIHVKEHTIANSHEENLKPDLRLDSPFCELENMANEIDLNTMTPEQLRHTPYILLYLKALEVYRAQKGDKNAFPSEYKQKQEIRKILDEFRQKAEVSSGKESENFEEARAGVNRSFQITRADATVKEIFADSQCSTSAQPFWIVCEAIRRFSETHNGVLPLRGTLPDMTSDTKSYTRLSSLFHEKAQADAKEVLLLTKTIEKERGVGDLISDDMCLRFCKNASRIRIQRGKHLSYDQEIKNIVEILKEITEGDGDKVDCTVWLLLLRAAAKFRKEKGRFPGTNGVPVSIDGQDLKKRVEALVIDSVENKDDAATVLKHVPDSAIAEVCRYGATELHVISSYIGGVASQEVIKLATNQYVPIDNTLVFDGHTQESKILKL